MSKDKDDKDKDKQLPKVPEESILNTLEKTAPHGQIQETLAKVKGKNAEATVLDELRACYRRGEDWLLEFGRWLVIYRIVCKHGKWAKTLEAEFGLHRQTAHRWMRNAAEADGYNLPEDESKTQEDETDEFSDKVTSKIAEERQERDDVQDSASRKFKLVLVKATDQEIHRYNERVKNELGFVQTILRRAFEQILAGKPDVPPVPQGKRRKLEMLPDDSAPDSSDLLSKKPEDEGDDNGA